MTKYAVTVNDRGYEVTIVVEARSATEAKREALRWHRGAKVLHVEASS